MFVLSLVTIQVCFGLQISELFRIVLRECTITVMTTYLCIYSKRLLRKSRFEILNEIEMITH